jgi:hypothetical protein
VHRDCERPSMVGGTQDRTHEGMIRLDRSTTCRVGHSRTPSSVHSMPMGASAWFQRSRPPAPGEPYSVWVVPGRRPFRPFRPRGTEARPAGDSDCLSCQKRRYPFASGGLRALTVSGGGPQRRRPTKPSGRKSAVIPVGATLTIDAVCGRSGLQPCTRCCNLTPMLTIGRL